MRKVCSACMSAIGEELYLEEITTGDLHETRLAQASKPVYTSSHV